MQHPTFHAVVTSAIAHLSPVEGSFRNLTDLKEILHAGAVAVKGDIGCTKANATAEHLLLAFRAFRRLWSSNLDLAVSDFKAGGQLKGTWTAPSTWSRSPALPSRRTACPASAGSSRN